MSVLEAVPDLARGGRSRAGRGRGAGSSRARRPPGPCVGRRPWRPRPRGSARSLLELLRPRLSMSASRRFSICFAPRRSALSSEGRSRWRASSSTDGDHVGREVDDLLEVLRGEVEQVAEPARDTLEVPDVGDRSGQLDVAHPLAAHLGAGHLDAAALADDALEADALVLAAVALPVPGGTEDLLAEEAVLLRLERAVVDGLRLLDLAVRPLRGCRPRWPGRCASSSKKLTSSTLSLLSLGVQPVSLSQYAVPGARCRSDLVDAHRALVRRRDRSMPSSSAARKTSSSVSRISIDDAVAGEHLDVEAQRLHLLDQHLEGLRDAGLGDVLALDDRLVDLRRGRARRRT